ncbi:MAG: hypothetical protein M9904_17620 [Chitinophagaceae bacterium]|nr:hypothetical protein [Chitinophagaceae bacterium]
MGTAQYILIQKISLLLITLFPLVSAATTCDTIPLKVNGNWTDKNIRHSEHTILFEDTLGIVHHISLMVDNDNIPELFTSHIETPVCSDSLCNLMNIRIYWTLSGNYLGFDTIPGKPLTKNDHLNFNGEDFQQLHRLLCDEQSILRRRHKDDLFDKEATRVSQVVDAVTGATSKEVKEVTVDGAVYSSYTIYHLVHSQLSGVIKRYVTDSLLTLLDKRLSTSDRVDERIFFWQQIPAARFPQYQKEITETIEMASPKDRLFVMKKTPGEMWANPDFIVRIAGIGEQLDVYSLSHFLSQLKSTPTIPAACLSLLGNQMKSFSQNQLNTYLSLIEKTPASLQHKTLLEILQNAEADTQYKYRTIIGAFLKNHR